MTWFLSFKRIVRPGFVILCLFIMLCIYFGAGISDHVELRPAGLVSEDPKASEIVEKLEKKGFILYEDRASMIRALEDNSLDAGAVLLPGISDRAAANELADSVLLLSSPDAFLTEVYEAQILATLYTETAPLRTVQGAEDAGVILDYETVRQAFQDMISEGYRFRFDIEKVDGSTPESRELGKIISEAISAILLFAASISGTIRIRKRAGNMTGRIGRKNMILHILFPELLFQSLFLLLTVIPGCLLVPHTDLLKTLFSYASYVVLLTGIGLLLSSVPLKLDLLLPVFLLGSLAFYPIYYDLSDFFEGAVYIRKLLPPCWLPAILKMPLPAFLTGLLLCVFSEALQLIRRHS